VAWHSGGSLDAWKNQQFFLLLQFIFLIPLIPIRARLAAQVWFQAWFEWFHLCHSIRSGFNPPQSTQTEQHRWIQSSKLKILMESTEQLNIMHMQSTYIIAQSQDTKFESSPYTLKQTENKCPGVSLYIRDLLSHVWKIFKATNKQNWEGSFSKLKIAW